MIIKYKIVKEEEKIDCSVMSFDSEMKLQASILSTFYSSIFRTKVLLSSYVLAKKALLYKKCTRKMLMKLTPGEVKKERKNLKRESFFQKNESIKKLAFLLRPSL